MAKLIRGVFALLLVVFLSACPSGDPDLTEVSGGRVVAPVIKMNPSRPFNNGPIEISFTSTTSDVEFYYTLDGSVPSSSAGVKYNGPFSLAPGNENIRDTPSPGFIRVRVIGIKEGLTDSSIRSQLFQIFPNEPIKDGTGNEITSSATGIGAGGYHDPSQKVLVTVTVTNGVISAVYENGYNDTTLHTSEYWKVATDRADLFLSTMNSWEFDTITGATRSSQAIKEGLEKAMAS